MREIHAALVRVVRDFFDFRPRTAMASALLKAIRPTNPVWDRNRCSLTHCRSINRRCRKVQMPMWSPQCLTRLRVELLLEQGTKNRNCAALAFGLLGLAVGAAQTRAQSTSCQFNL